MASHSKIWVRTAIAVLVLIVAVVLVSTLGRPPAKRAPQVFKLADGGEFHLYKATFGTQHEFPEPTALQRLANKWPIPFGIVFDGCMPQTTPTPTLALWHASDPNSSAFPDPPDGKGTFRPDLNSLKYLVCDEAGYGLPSSGSGSSSIGSFGSHREFSSEYFSNFPRRGRTITIRAYRDNSVVYPYPLNGATPRSLPPLLPKVLEFRLPNPAAGTFSNWQAEPLPSVKRDGDLEVTLASFVTGLSSYGSAPARDAVESWTRSQYRVKRNGRVDTDWNLHSVTISDATGNAFSGSDMGLPEPWRRTEAWGRGWLWPDEPAWRIRVELARTGNFAPGELWTIRGIPVAGNFYAQTNFPNTSLATSGCRTDPRNPRTVLLHFELNPAPAGWLFTPVAVINNRSQPVPVESSSWSGGSYDFQLAPPPGTSSLDATVAWHRVRVVDFLARPQQASKPMAGKP